MLGTVYVLFCILCAVHAQTEETTGSGDEASTTEGSSTTIDTTTEEIITTTTTTTTTISSVETESNTPLTTEEFVVPPLPTLPSLPPSPASTPSSELIPLDVLALLPYLLQIILPLLNAATANTPPPATQPPPTPTPSPPPTTQRPTRRPFVPYYPNYGFGSYGFGFPFDYNSLYNPYPQYSFYGDSFFPFRGASLQRNRTQANTQLNTSNGYLKKQNNNRNKVPFRRPFSYTVDSSHFLRSGTGPDPVSSLKAKRRSKNIKMKKKNEQKKRRKHKVKRKKTKSNIKKTMKPFAFFKRIRVPGKNTVLTVKSKDLKDQIDLFYLGKSYHLSIKQIMQQVQKSPMHPTKLTKKIY